MKIDLENQIKREIHYIPIHWFEIKEKTGQSIYKNEDKNMV